MSKNPGEIDDSVQLEPVFDAMVESMIVIDDSGTIERVNKATQGMFGYEDEELIGQNIKMLMPGSEQIRHDNYLQRYQKTGKRRIIGIGREIIIMRKDGIKVPASSFANNA